jgi:hypothetical protein
VINPVVMAMPVMGRRPYRNRVAQCYFESLVNNKHQQKINNMDKLQDDKCSDKTKKTGEVRMGREVSSKNASGCDSEKDPKRPDKKEELREDRASALV